MFPFNIVEKFYDRKVDSTGLDVFRLVYSLILFLQAFQLAVYKPLIFGDVMWPGVLIYAWIPVTLCLLIGFQTRLCAILNYILTVILVMNIKTYTYDFDKIMISMNFLMMFIPLNRSLSLDRLLGRKAERTTSLLSYYIPVLICLGLPYLDSVIHKIYSVNWMTGMGIWAPMAKTQMIWLPWIDYSIMLNNKFLTSQINFFVLVFELSFIFLFWFRKMRVILALTGFFMHIGILLIFPIPLFALGCASLYILLLSPDFLRKSSVLRLNGKVPPTLQTEPGMKRNRIVMIGCYLILCVGIQMDYFINYSVGKQYALNPSKLESTGFLNEGRSRNFDMGKMNDAFLIWATKITGIGSHRVFLDHHINNNRLILAVVYKMDDGREQWLPLITPRGHPDHYLRDRIWSRWTSYVMGANLTTETRFKEIANMIDFWCDRQNKACSDGHFVLKLRKSVTAGSWQNDILSIQAGQPWQDIGKAQRFKGRVFFQSYSE